MQGKPPAEIEQLLRFLEQTVYDWLDIVVERDLTALSDLPHPGQSTRITDDQWRVLEELQTAPGQVVPIGKLEGFNRKEVSIDGRVKTL